MVSIVVRYMYLLLVVRLSLICKSFTLVREFASDRQGALLVQTRCPVLQSAMLTSGASHACHPRYTTLIIATQLENYHDQN